MKLNTSESQNVTIISRHLSGSTKVLEDWKVISERFDTEDIFRTAPNQSPKQPHSDLNQKEFPV